MTKAQNAEFVDRILAVLEGTKRLGPEYFQLKTKLIIQEGREYIAEKGIQP